MRVAVDRMGLEAARRPRAPEETRRADILNRSRQWDSVRSDRDVFIVGLIQMETTSVGRVVAETLKLALRFNWTCPAAGVELRQMLQ